MALQQVAAARMPISAGDKMQLGEHCTFNCACCLTHSPHQAALGAPFDRARGFWVETLNSQPGKPSGQIGNEDMGVGSFEFVAAYDMNPRANEAYTHLHGAPPPLNTNLETISHAALASHSCTMWLMSPPCQPYTSLSGQADAKDPRSKALHHIFTNVLPALAEPPSHLAIENVPAFLWSEGRSMVVAALQRLRYVIEEFELCPTLFGIPNKRRRYFLIARRRTVMPAAAVFPLCCPNRSVQSDPNCDSGRSLDDAAPAAPSLHLIEGAASPLEAASSYGVKYFLPSFSARSEVRLKEIDGIRCIGSQSGGSSCSDGGFVGDEDLEEPHTEFQCLTISREGSVVAMQLPPSSSDQIWGRWQPIYASPLHHAAGALPVSHFLDDERQLHAWAAAGANSIITEADLDCISRGSLKVDVARRCSVTTSCFTKGYARILRRAGPLFLQRHASPASLSGAPTNASDQPRPLVLSLRRFTPSEQSRLMCLPPGAVNPCAAVSPQNWHKLLGNSVNVHVCACVLLHMLRGDVA